MLSCRSLKRNNVIHAQIDGKDDLIEIANISPMSKESVIKDGIMEDEGCNNLKALILLDAKQCVSLTNGLETKKSQ